VVNEDATTTKTEGPHVKTMTCRQLGGPRDLEHRGETVDDVIKANDRHPGLRRGPARRSTSRHARR
jgi:hypothetical protein